MDATSIFAAALGVASHLLLFIRGEWHVLAPQVLSSYIFSFFLVIGLYHWGADENVSSSTSVTLHLTLCHLLGLFGSIIIYRIAFHPLRRFPGPVFAKLSKLWHIWGCRTSQNHLFLDNLRKKYGDFVRTGMDIFNFSILYSQFNLGISDKWKHWFYNNWSRY